MQSLTEQKAERRDLDRAFAFRRSALSINHHGVESHSASTAAVESRVSIAPNLDFNSPRAPQILSRLSELPRKVKDDIWGIAAMAELHAIPKKGNMTFVNFEVGTFLHEQIRGIKAVRSLERYNFDGFVLQRVTRFEVVSRPLTTYGRKIVRILRKRSLKNTRLSFDDRPAVGKEDHSKDIYLEKKFIRTCSRDVFVAAGENIEKREGFKILRMLRWNTCEEIDMYPAASL